VTSTVTFSASIPTVFWSLIGDVDRQHAALCRFLFVARYSPSMGVGATPTDVKTMVNNAGQCAFARHDISDSNNYYNQRNSA
jgi:hypothetical protein